MLGDEVTVTRSGFSPNSPIVIALTPPNQPGGAQGETTDGTGTFVFTFAPDQVVPDPIGNWTVTFSQPGGCSDSVTIGVACVADLSATPASVPPTRSP